MELRPAAHSYNFARGHTAPWQRFSQMARTLSQIDPSLSLKSMPPRAGRGFLSRERLSLSRLELGGVQALALLAPTGFGKTAQLVQWRRDALSRGMLAFWYTVDERDEPMRMVYGLACAARQACGKRGFDDDFMVRLEHCVSAQDAITLWLAEVARMSVDAMLFIDDAEHLPAAARTQVLGYLLGNLPSNLMVAVAARSSGALLASGMLEGHGLNRVMAGEMRFQLDETVAVLSAALGARCDADAAARLHAITEGWPLGVQLAVGALSRGGDMEALLDAASSDIRHHFVDAVIDRLGADALHLMVRIARFGLLHPELCTQVLGSPVFGELLLQLQLETPLLVRAEGESWMRLHPLAREVLFERLQRLPAHDLQALSRSASDWYASHDLLEEAGEQALLAGDGERALELVERASMRMTMQGRSVALLTWYGRLSRQSLDQRPAFWVPVAWALSVSERHAEAQPLLDRILAQPGVTPQLAFEAALIGAAASAFADCPDSGERWLSAWPAPPPGLAPGLAPIHMQALAFLELQAGHPDQARLLCERAARLEPPPATSPVPVSYIALLIGLCHLWEGRSALAIEGLRTALARSQERLGHQHALSCMISATLAQALWECACDNDASALLAGRLDTLQSFGLPDAQMAAYRTLARIAASENRQAQALSLLDTLQALGRARGQLRLQVLAQTELVRLHARHGRTETAAALCADVDDLLRGARASTPHLLLPWLDLHVELARAQALLVQEGSRQASQALAAAEAAAALAKSLKRNADLIEAQLLRAEALRRCGSADARTVKAEALSLASAEGLQRLLREYGPTESALSPHTAAPAAASTAAPQRSIPSAVMAPAASRLLTGKEQEVLVLLERNLSNKEIALAMGVGEQTVKWHVKNLFNKLNAGSRKHAAARARQMGLLPMP